MTKREMLFKSISENLAGDIDLVSQGNRSLDVLGTLRVNRDVALKRFPEELSDLIEKATHLLEV